MPFSAALVGAAATVGPIIPPSIIMVIYASIANVSIGRMFLGGIVPGLLMGGALMALTAFLARRKDFPRGERLDELRLDLAGVREKFRLGFVTTNTALPPTALPYLAKGTP